MPTVRLADLSQSHNWLPLFSVLLAYLVLGPVLVLFSCCCIGPTGYADDADTLADKAKPTADDDDDDDKEN
jgi:hypothetical protein